MKLLSILWIIFLFFDLTAQSQPPYSPTPPLPGNIISIEWFVDHDPSIGLGSQLPVTPTPDIHSLTAPISLTGLPPGIHHLFVRSTDNEGHSAIISATTFENFHPAYGPDAPGPSPLTELEVAFDKDPGLGKASRISLTASTNIHGFTFSPGIDTLTPGPHRLYIRSLNGISSLSQIISFSNDGPLPLTWLYVKGQISNDQSLITWATGQESHTLQFEIEYGTDGHTFHIIGSVPAAGNSPYVNEYKWIHTSPLPGMNYYRIRQLDADGKYSYSTIVALLYKTGLKATLAAPNPVHGDLLLLFASAAERSTLILFNADGQPILSKQIKDGALQQHLDMSGYPSGVYLLQLRNKAGTEIIRIVKE